MEYAVEYMGIYGKFLGKWKYINLNMQPSMNGISVFSSHDNVMT